MNKRNLSLLAITALVIVTSGATMGAAFLPTLMYLAAIFIAFKRGASIKRVSFVGSLCSAVLGILVMVAFQQTGVELGLLLSATIAFVFCILGAVYAWLLGINA